MTKEAQHSRHGEQAIIDALTGTNDISIVWQRMGPNETVVLTLDQVEKFIREQKNTTLGSMIHLEKVSGRPDLYHVAFTRIFNDYNQLDGIEILSNFASKLKNRPMYDREIVGLF